MKRIYALRVTIFFSFIICVSSVLGQNTNDTIKLRGDSLLEEITDIDKKVQQFISVDTIGGKVFRQMLDSFLVDLIDHNKLNLRDENGLLKSRHRDWQPFHHLVDFRDTVIFDPSFLPVVFDGKILPDNLSFTSSDMSFYESQSLPAYHLISPDSTMQPLLNKTNQIRQVRRSYYTHNPQDVWVNAMVFDKSLAATEAPIKKSSIFDGLLKSDDVVSISTPNVETITIKKSNWRFIGEHSLQMSQNQVSDTWYGGGDNKYDLKNYHKINLDYKRKKIAFENQIEWRLNIRRSSADEMRKTTIADDYLKIYSVFGVEAFKKWSYSINMDVNTPLFLGFKANTSSRLRSPLSPLNVNVGLGMRYSYEKQSATDKSKKIKLGVDLSPLSMQLRYVRDTSVINSNTNYGIDAGKHSKLEFGSKVVGNLTWNISRYADLTSSLTYFTNYERVQVDMVNRLNYSLNRYFSVTLDLALRFDDSVDKEDDKFKYLQYNETLSFGLNYKW